MSIRFKMNDLLKTLIAKEVENVSSVAPICPFLLGEPGIGKSSIVRSMCEEHGWLFHELLCNQLSDRADITGCRTVNSQKEVNGKMESVWEQVFFPHKALQDAIIDAENNPDKIVVVLLDEINRTSSDITSAALSFITARTIGTCKFPDNIRFIAAGNDKGNVVSIDSASNSRFSQYRLEPDAQSWIEHERSTHGLSPYIEMVLKTNPELIFCKETGTVTSTLKDDDGDQYENEYAAFDESAEGFNQITTPRTLSGLNALLTNMSFDEISALSATLMKDADTGEDVSALQAVVYSHTGHTQFSLTLIEKIVNDITSGNMKKSAKSTKPPVKPAAYTAVKRCTDRTTMMQMIGNMSSDEMSELLVYMIYEKGVNNSDIINIVASAFKEQYLSMVHFAKLQSLYNADKLDTENYNAFVNSNTEVSRNTDALLTQS